MNNWEAVCLGPDLGKGVVLHAWWRGTELAIWRSMSGKPSAFRDRCPHRGMRLSHGFVRGETLSCIYHGWVYRQSGACSHIPAHPDLVPPATIKAENLTCIDHGGVVFVSDSADTSGLPDLSGLSPVRSLNIALPAAKVIEALPEPGQSDKGLFRLKPTIAGRPTELAVFIGSEDGSESRLHVLAGAGADPVMVSRWLEEMRRKVEGQVAA